MNLSDIQKMTHGLAVEKGWWDGKRPNPREDIMCKIALIHAELSEAIEAIRDGDNLSDVTVLESGKPDGTAIELADAVIRIMDVLAYFGHDLEELVLQKHEYNKTRPYKHGRLI